MIKKQLHSNNKYFNIQIKNIQKTLDYIKTNCVDCVDNNKEEFNNKTEEFNNNTFNQTMLAYKWCKYYKVSINYNSKYIKYYKNNL